MDYLRTVYEYVKHIRTNGKKSVLIHIDGVYLDGKNSPKGELKSVYGSLRAVEFDVNEVFRYLETLFDAQQYSLFAL